MASPTSSGASLPQTPTAFSSPAGSSTSPKALSNSKRQRTPSISLGNLCSASRTPQRSGSPAKKVKSSFDGLVFADNPRKFIKWVKARGGFSHENAIEVFRIYPWQLNARDVPPTTLDRVEKLLNMRGIQWPAPGFRANLLHQKVVRTLDQSLKKLGWICGWGTRDKNGRKVFAFAQQTQRIHGFRICPTGFPTVSNSIQTTRSLKSSQR